MPNLTKEECQALIGFIDLGVKAGGLQVAQNAVYLSTKLNDILKALNEVKEEPKA